MEFSGGVNFVTDYASPHRSEAADIQRQRRIHASHYAMMKQCFDAISEIVLILNENRQIVFFNHHVPQLLNREPDSLYGLRPGEALGCIYSCENSAGCGTTKFCSECGAVNAILSALSEKKDLRECLIQQVGGNAFDLLVKTTPLTINGENYCIAAVTDISHDKRRRMLEHVFFHDVMNTALSIQVLSRLINQQSDSQNVSEMKQNLTFAVRQLIDEIQSQKDFLAAESNELRPVFRVVSTVDILKELAGQFVKSCQDSGIRLSVSSPPPITINGQLHKLAKNSAGIRLLYKEKLLKLGLRKETTWTAHEIDTFKKYYKTLPYKKTAEKLGNRTPDAVKGKALGLGLTRTP